MRNSRSKPSKRRRLPPHPLTDAQWADNLANRNAARSLKATHGRYPGRFSGAAWLRKVKQQAFRCFWCHRRLPLRQLTVDHLFAVSKPGHRGDIHSVVAACKRCNQQRGNRDVAEFIAWLDAQQRPLDRNAYLRQRRCHHGPHNRPLKRLRRQQTNNQESSNRKEAA